MTRKEFMSTMLKEILGYKGIIYLNTNNNIIEYKTGGTFTKDCTYNSYYENQLSEMIVSLFNNEAKKVSLDKGQKKVEEDVEQYQERAKKFIVSLIKPENDNGAIITEKLDRLKLSDFKRIYTNIIISEIFNIKSEQTKKHGEDDFQKSKNRISQEIIEYLSSDFDDYKEKNEGFFKRLSEEIKVKSFYSDIFYKSSMLRNYNDIKEYIKDVNIELVDLSFEAVTDFKGEVVYKYTGECFFESIDNTIRVTIVCNEEKISAVTSWKNWIVQSIISNYAYENKSRNCVCYFIYDQGKVFQFLQIGEE